ncbi:hypothetical protein CR513_25640, partial [Mucuna pruriens]
MGLKVEQVFKCFDFNDQIKVKLVTLKFSMLHDVKRRRRPSAKTWAKLRRELRSLFFPIILKIFTINSKDYIKSLRVWRTITKK